MFEKKTQLFTGRLIMVLIVILIIIISTIFLRPFVDVGKVVQAVSRAIVKDW